MLKTAMIFTDRMVLQRDKDIPVWGTANPSDTITVTFDGNKTSTTADQNGNWKLCLPPHQAGVGYTMTIEVVGETITLTDILVGEVWLAGGQSNMEFLLGFEQHFEEEVLAKAMNPNIRFFDYPEASYEGALEDFNYKYEGFWRGCTPEDLPFFSAAGYYFARNLEADLNVPIGIVGCNWGGTPASAWMDPSYLMGNEGQVWVDEHEEAMKGIDLEAYKANYPKDPANDRTNMLFDPNHIHLVKYELPREEQLAIIKQWENNPPLVEGPYYERRPGGLYETMLKKVWPFAVRGVIWYQGCTDGDFHAREYTTVFSQMIRCWRDLWNEELPFLFVQLAPFYRWLTCEGTNYHIVRECQDQVSRTVPGTWMASIGDVGMKWDIHPKNKLAVGERLALLARGHVYGEDLLCDAPEMEKITKCGDQVEVVFRHADGLHMTGDQLNALTGVTADGSTRDLTQANITADETLMISGCEDIVRLEFATGEYYEVNVYNKAGIPVKPWSALL